MQEMTELIIGIILFLPRTSIRTQSLDIKIMTAKEIEEKVISRMRLQHKAYKTEISYLGWIRRYNRWLCGQRPLGSSAEKMGAFLSYLARVEEVAASTQNQAFNALLYMYRTLGVELGEVKSLRAKPGKFERHAPSLREIQAVRDVLRDANGHPVRLLFDLLYGCGLRVSEPLGLRVKDVRLDRRELIIRQAKGGKDRVVKIPPSLYSRLQLQIQSARLIFERDAADGVPIQVPSALGRRSKSLCRQWGWMFVFPGHVPVVHPRSGETVRFSLHPGNIQREVARACRVAELTVPFTPHNLRHSYATHCLDSGANVHDVCECLGHASLETTKLYLHPQVDRVASPLELLEAVV
jgi:integrase